jgi:hypothetical protein
MIFGRKVWKILWTQTIGLGQISYHFFSFVIKKICPAWISQLPTDIYGSLRWLFYCIGVKFVQFWNMNWLKFSKRTSESPLSSKLLKIVQNEIIHILGEKFEMTSALAKIGTNSIKFTNLRKAKTWFGISFYKTC